MRYATLIAAVACVLCGCATSADQEPLAVRKEPVYRTGSNIAVKNADGQQRVLTVRPDEVHTTQMPRPPGGGAP